MMPDLLPSVKLTELSVKAAEGCFAVKAPCRIYFERCRERFARLFAPDIEGFYFSVLPQTGKNVAEFMWKVENVLEIKKHTNFAMSNFSNVIWIEPNDFWRSCIMKRSLFTALLRAGIKYDPEKDNFEEALFQAKHLEDTPRALMRFMFGFTEYHGPELDEKRTTSYITKGWWTVFKDISDGEIRNYLRLPNNSVNLESNALWL